MADGIPPNPPVPDPPSHPGDPPPLSSIRVKGPGAKGLNKPAILLAAGGGIALVLLLASGSLTPAKPRTPAETKPMMSDPARPEMAQTAIRDLPATYAEAGAATQPSRAPAEPPLLGPPLPGDVAAFAPDDGIPPANPASWEHDASSAMPPDTPDPAAKETQQADRSGIFFDLRQSPQPAGAQPAPQQQNPLATLARAPDDQQAPQLNPAADRALHPGAIIPASLITAINSEAPGPVIAQVTQSVYDSATGRTLLIPQGARLIGDYKSNSKFGQSRIAIAWSRLIMPDGDEILLEEAATDLSGAAGVKGQVDNHWIDVFGAAALGTIINIGVATTEENPSVTFGGVGAVSTYDPVEDAVRDGVQRSAAIVTNRTVDRALSIPATIRVDAGTRISVIITRRLGSKP